MKSILVAMLFGWLSVHSMCSHGATAPLDGASACARAAASIDRVRHEWTQEQVQADFDGWVRQRHGYATNPSYVAGVEYLIEGAYSGDEETWMEKSIPICIEIMNGETS